MKIYENKELIPVTGQSSPDDYRTMVESCCEGIVIIQDGMIKYANDSAMNISGYSLTELSGMLFTDMLHTDEVEYIANRHENRLAGKDFSSESRFRIHAKGGHVRWIEANAKMVEWHGRPAVLCSVRDITEPKRSEEQLKKFKYILDRTADCVFMFHPESLKFKYVNQGAIDQIGYSHQELLNLTPLDITTELSPDCLKSYLDSLKSGEKSSITFETVHLNKNGKHIPVEILLQYVQAECDCFVAIARDISERQKIELQLRQSQKMESIGTLAGGIAHDFNNILAAILGYADLAKMDVPEDSKTASDLEVILESGNRAKELVRQILNICRQTEMERMPIQIDPIVKEALKLLQATIPSEIEIHQDIPTDCGSVLGDPSQIHQIIMNLCTNAYHAMRGKEGILEVSLNPIKLSAGELPVEMGLKEGSYVQLVVSDTGHGIEKAKVNKIFDPYFTTKVQGDGTGLGLSIINGIVKSCGGLITVESQVEKGTTFHVYFPVIACAAITETQGNGSP